MAKSSNYMHSIWTGTREFVRVTRKSEPDDLFNSALGGFASGAILGRLQGQNSLSLSHEWVSTMELD